MRKFKNKKSQMEMFGLAVIVILVTFGLFFVVKFKMKEKPVQYQKEYILDQGASNFVISVANMDIDECSSRQTLRLLIKDCATKQFSINCGGMDSCTLANQTIHTILNRTFVEWNYKFRFFTEDLSWEQAYGPPGTPYSGEIYFNNFNCSDTDPKAPSGIEEIPLYPIPGNVRMVLELCKT